DRLRIDRLPVAIYSDRVMGRLANIQPKEDLVTVITCHPAPPVSTELGRTGGAPPASRYARPFCGMSLSRDDGAPERSGATHPRSLTTGACQPCRARPVRWPQPIYRPRPRTRRKRGHVG